MKALFIWLLAITAFCAATQHAHAQHYQKGEFDRQGYGMRPTGSGTYQFSPLVDLMKQNHQHTPLLDRMARENRTPTADARSDVSKQGSDLVVGQRGKFKPPGTKDPLVVDVESKVIKNPAFGRAVAKFAMNMVPVVQWGGAIATLINDLGLLHDGEDGTNRFYETESWNYQKWRRGDQFGHINPNGPLYNSPAEACSPSGAPTECTNNGWTYSCSVTLGGSPPGRPDMRQCITTFTPIGHNNQIAPQVRDHAVGQGEVTGQTREYLTESELAERITADPSWSGDYWDEVVRDMLDAGQKVPIGDTTVSGPSSAPGPTTTSTETTPGANGQPVVRTTTTTSNNTINYNQNTVNITNISTTTITENGDIISETETTTEPETPPEESATDSSLPSVPDLYEQKYPDGLVGVWNDRKAALMQSPLLSLLGQLMPTITPGGTCPQWLLTVDVGVANFGTHDVAPPCGLWPILAAIVIVSALLLARRLIFGG